MNLPGEATASRRNVAMALFLVLAVRLLHMRFAIDGPLTWQLGPDEEFYFAFGRDVAAGSGGMAEIFAFMDPLYGYIVGAVLGLGARLFPLYLLQILVDCASAYGLYRIASELDRPRAGVAAIVMYALTGTAIAYTMAVLKETFVVAFVVWWTLLAVRLVRSPSLLRWAGFGAVCGLGIALRANFLMVVPLAVPLLAWIRHREGSLRARPFLAGVSVFLVALAMPLLLLLARNVAISGKASPLPNNGGVVLHQLYNPDNPASRSAVPRFVGRYSEPEHIWAAYRREAERRAGRPLRPQDVEAYWAHEARIYLASHPAQSARNALRKLIEASAYPEVPNNRNYADERLVSPVLRALPPPFGWLFAFGLPGLVLMAWRDRRALLVVVPALVALATIAVFFAEDRFRFHLVPALVLGSAWWLDSLAAAVARRDRRRIAVGLVLPALLGTWTVLQARGIPDTPSDWRRLAWGYLKSGQRARAEELITRHLRDGTDPGGTRELAGYLAAVDGRWDLALQHYDAAVALQPDRHDLWHNYSLALERSGDIRRAWGAEQRALQLTPRDGPYLLRAGDLAQRVGGGPGATRLWTAAAESPDPATAEQAKRRLLARGDATRQPAAGN